MPTKSARAIHAGKRLFCMKENCPEQQGYKIHVGLSLMGVGISGFTYNSEHHIWIWGNRFGWVLAQNIHSKYWRFRVS